MKEVIIRPKALIENLTLGFLLSSVLKHETLEKDFFFFLEEVLLLGMCPGPDPTISGK